MYLSIRKWLIRTSGDDESAIPTNGSVAGATGAFAAALIKICALQTVLVPSAQRQITNYDIGGESIDLRAVRRSIQLYKRRRRGRRLRHIRQPVEHPHHIHCRPSQHMGQMCFRQAHVAGATHLTRPNCLRNRSLHPCPLGILRREACRLFACAPGLQRCIVRLRTDTNGPARWC